MAFALLGLLLPLPRPRAMSETPWLVEFLTTAVLAVYLLAGSLGYGTSSPRNLLLTSRDAATRWLIRLVAIFTLWSALSALWAGSAYLTVHHALLWTEYLLFFLFVRARLEHGDGELLPRVFAVVAAVLGTLCLIEYVTLPNFTALEGVIRTRYGAYAELLVTALPVLWAYGIAAETFKRRSLLLSAAGAGWIVVMLSLSKGAFLAGVGGAIVAFAGAFVAAKETRRIVAASATAWLVLTITIQAGFSILSPVPATVDYLSGKADATRETSRARIEVWKVALQMVSDNPVLGVGADNFGLAFNRSRAARRIDHPTDPNDEPVSDNLIQRGHNEVLQVTAELGIIGLILFIAPFAFLVLVFVRNKNKASPLLWASIGGMLAFGASSMVSSFSFRIAQNGIVFFIVLAVALNETRASKDRDDGAAFSRHIFILALIFCVISLAIFGTKGYAERTVLNAAREPDPEKAAALYDRAVLLDPAYATAYLNRSARFYSSGDFKQAAIDLRKAINGGCGVVITYSALAASYEKSNDQPEAERTFNEALRIFPRSVFLRVRFARFLEDGARPQDAESQMAVARDVDKRQADGWYNLLTIGSTRAFYAARDNADLAPPAELKPEAAVLQYLDKQPGE